MSKEVKYYNFEEILKKLNLYHDFNNKHEYLPQVFNHKIEEFDFSWGEIIIPKKGIRETVMNALSKKAEIVLNELKFIWIIPYKLDKISPITKHEISTYGNIYQNISLTFRHDKILKWGEITNSLEECCFFILEYAKDIGDFYVITGKDNVQDFINQVIIPNQYGTKCEWASEILPAMIAPKAEDDSLTENDSEYHKAIDPDQLHFHNGRIYDPEIVNKNELEGKSIQMVKEPDVNANILPDGIMIPKVSDYFFDEFRALSPESKREVLENLKNIIESEDENEADVINPIIDASAEIHALAESVKKDEDIYKGIKGVIEDIKHGEDIITKSIRSMIDNDEIEKPVLDEISKRWEIYFDTDASHPTNPCPESVPKDDEE